MSYFTIGHRLPRFLAAPLFGDRTRWGLKIDHSDSMWREWEKTYLKFYNDTQKESVGNRVNHAGYRILEEIDFSGKRILEIGPGDIRHLSYWKKKPEEYVIADIQQAMLERSSGILSEHGIPHKSILLQLADSDLPFDDASFDSVVSFYALEHISSLEPFLIEVKRVLRRDGVFVGAIPAEGGLAWGGGGFSPAVAGSRPIQESIRTNSSVGNIRTLPKTFFRRWIIISLRKKRNFGLSEYPSSTSI